MLGRFDQIGTAAMAAAAAANAIEIADGKTSIGSYRGAIFDAVQFRVDCGYALRSQFILASKEKIIVCLARIARVRRCLA